MCLSKTSFSMGIEDSPYHHHHRDPLFSKHSCCINKQQLQAMVACSKPLTSTASPPVNSSEFDLLKLVSTGA